MADDIFVSNDIELDVDFGEIYVIDQGVVTKVVAKKYDPTKTYIVGDYVIYNDNLYRCITAIEEPEEFNIENWTKVWLADEVQIINSTLPTKADKADTYTKQEVNTALADKADKSDTYTKQEVDTSLSLKADQATTYTKTEVDTALSAKANTTDVNTALDLKADKATTYTKSEVDADLLLKADKSDTYTKSDVNDYLDLKADKSTTYTKTEVDTALNAKADSDDVYEKTETYSKTEVDNIISNLPAPMIFKGTLGTGGTITTLPTASSENEGYTYKVITDGTYASQAAKAGDMFTSNGSAWIYIPSGDETFTDTWRGIKVNGTEQLTSSIASGDVDFVNGTNSTVVFDATGNKIKVNVDGYTQSEVDTKLALKADASTTYTKTEVDTALGNKADKSTTYTKTEVDTALSGKADTSTTYTKSEVDSALSSKANSADVYTKTQTDTALANKANTTGEYDNLTSGQANALKPSARLENSTPYLYRPSFSNGYGYETLIGGTCGVNQLVYEPDVWTSDPKGFKAGVSFVTGHKLLMIVGGTANDSFKVYVFGNVGGTVSSFNSGIGSTIISCPFTFTQTVDGAHDTNNSTWIWIDQYASWSDGYINIIDLTQMFGSTIADYVYTLESGISGAGITWLKNNGFFGADYYPYNAGGLLSVKTSKKITTGKNFTDIADNTISGAGYVIGGFPVAINSDNSILPSGNYVFSFDVQNATYPCACQLIWYNNGVEVGNTVENISASGINAIAFTASGKFDSIVMFCNSSSGGAFTNFNLNIGSTPSEYEPYVSHEYPLDDIELRGILKLDGNNNLYYDGDTYESNGSVTRKYGIVDLGGLNWVNDTTAISGVYNLKADLTEIAKSVPVTDIFNAICEVYQSISAYDVYNCNEGICTNADGSSIFVYDANYNTSSSATAFKTAMDGHYLVYELATPTTETADAFTNPMIVDANGSEEFVDGNVYGIVDLGSLDYVYSDNGFVTQLPNNAKELNSNSEVLNCICDMYNVLSWNDATYNKQSGTMGTGISRYIVIYNSAYTDAATFKTAMSGVYLIYEKASSTGVEMPVGHETIYVDNSDKTKLDNLPDISDSGDGTYIIKQTSGQMTLDKYGEFSSTELTAVASLQWTTRANYYEKEGSCYIDILGGTPTGGFAENAVVFSGAPIPQSGYPANLIGLCDGAFYRFYVDATTGEVKCRNAISAGNTEFSVFGSYFVQ